MVRSDTVSFRAFVQLRRGVGLGGRGVWVVGVGRGSVVREGFGVGVGDAPTEGDAGVEVGEAPAGEGSGVGDRREG
ncbi:hypothetical protein GCM10007964_11960 [Sphaerisporangium melleum]|uniref:Uncharacterized protein n=1 Tax=Sphaerisporangium melleum TaxID=321316 RepID=A0A917QVP5_9ACTN|nr:hypothetical protein GCM10007964_11960 [Sphaerisporangium melleum]